MFSNFFVRGLFGMVIGGLISLLEVTRRKNSKPLAAALIERIIRFATAFRRIVFAPSEPIMARRSTRRRKPTNFQSYPSGLFEHSMVDYLPGIEKRMIFPTEMIL
jgi:hypothetical protein